MPLARFHQKANITGQKYARPVVMHVGMSEDSHPSVELVLEEVFEIGGARNIGRRGQITETLIEDDVLGADGVTVVTPNNLNAQIPIRNQTTGAIESTITYAEFFKILASAAQYLVQTKGF